MKQLFVVVLLVVGAFGTSLFTTPLNNAIPYIQQLKETCTVHIDNDSPATLINAFDNSTHRARLVGSHIIENVSAKIDQVTITCVDTTDTVRFYGQTAVSPFDNYASSTFAMMDVTNGNAHAMTSPLFLAAGASNINVSSVGVTGNIWIGTVDYSILTTCNNVFGGELHGQLNSTLFFENVWVDILDNSYSYDTHTCSPYTPNTIDWDFYTINYYVDGEMGFIFIDSDGITDDGHGSATFTATATATIDTTLPITISIGARITAYDTSISTYVINVDYYPNRPNRVQISVDRPLVVYRGHNVQPSISPIVNSIENNNIISTQLLIGSHNSDDGVSTYVRSSDYVVTTAWQANATLCDSFFTRPGALTNAQEILFATNAAAINDFIQAFTTDGDNFTCIYSIAIYSADCDYVHGANCPSVVFPSLSITLVKRETPVYANHYISYTTFPKAEQYFDPFNPYLAGDVMFSGDANGILLSPQTGQCVSRPVRPANSTFNNNAMAIANTFTPAALMTSDACPAKFSSCMNVSLCYTPSASVSCQFAQYPVDAYFSGGIASEFNTACFYNDGAGGCLSGWPFYFTVTNTSYFTVADLCAYDSGAAASDTRNLEITCAVTAITNTTHDVFITNLLYVALQSYEEICADYTAYGPSLVAPGRKRSDDNSNVRHKHPKRTTNEVFVTVNNTEWGSIVLTVDLLSNGSAIIGYNQSYIDTMSSNPNATVIAGLLTTLCPSCNQQVIANESSILAVIFTLYDILNPTTPPTSAPTSTHAPTTPAPTVAARVGSSVPFIIIGSVVGGVSLVGLTLFLWVTFKNSIGYIRVKTSD